MAIEQRNGVWRGTLSDVAAWLGLAKGTPADVADERKALDRSTGKGLRQALSQLIGVRFKTDQDISLLKKDQNLGLITGTHTIDTAYFPNGTPFSFLRRSNRRVNGVTFTPQNFDLSAEIRDVISDNTSE